MSLVDWYRYHIRREESPQDALYHLYLGTHRKIGEYVNYGTPIWEESWDMMIVLDACRYDMIAAIADELNWIEDVECRYSVGSESSEWLEFNFDEQQFSDELASVAYVSANGKTEAEIDPQTLKHLDEVWKYAFDFDWGSVPARSVTDRSIDVSRTVDPDRLLVHYMQPHLPIVPPACTPSEVPSCLLDTDWEDIRRDSEVTKHVLWKFSLENLRYVLGEVERLLNNVDSERVIITADHGNLFGELRGAGLWGHPPNTPVPLLKRVPWIVTEATNTANEEPDIERGKEVGELEEKLAALGYK